MKLENKFNILIDLEVFAALLAIAGISVLRESTVSYLKLWEIFPAFMAASLTTYGLKEMRKKT